MIAMISEHASPLSTPGGVDCGGQNVYVGQVAKHLALLGYSVDIFTRRDSESQPDIVEWADGIRIVHIRAGPSKFIRKEELLPHMGEFTSNLLKLFKWTGWPYELIHANFWMSGLVAADLKKTLGIPFLITFHALGKVRRIYQGEADQFSDRRFEIEERIVEEADRIIAECPQDEEDLIQLYRCDPRKIRMIPCGFDPAELWPVPKEGARKQLGLAPDSRLLLQVGRLVPRKGVDTAILGFSRLLKLHRAEARMIIVGGEDENPNPDLNPEMRRLSTLVQEEGIQDRVLFVGRKSRDALKFYYSAADAFITTPWYEPFGITPVEAMACGTPVIGASVGGIRFTVRDGETGFLVPPKDPDAISEKLAFLFARPTLIHEMGWRAIQRANANFTWKTITADIARLYGEIRTARAATQKSPEEGRASCRIFMEKSSL